MSEEDDAHEAEVLGFDAARVSGLRERVCCIHQDKSKITRINTKTSKSATRMNMKTGPHEQCLLVWPCMVETMITWQR